MATTFNVIYLGNLPDIDTGEGNQSVSTAAVNSWLGTYGSVADPLTDAANIKEFAPGSTGFTGGIEPAGYDIDNNAANETFTVDGVEQTFDAMMIFNATITYFDGTTANISAVVAQATNGDAYLMPEFAYNADQAALEAGPIRALTLNSPIYGGGNVGQGWNLFADRYKADFVPCFTPGTMIATPRGEIAVENLRAGDRIFTRDNGIQEIRWIGAKTLSAAELALKPVFEPVVIKADALGAGLPERDLLLSPNHRVLMTGQRSLLHFDESEVLASAKHLTRIDGIDRVNASGGVTYIHMLFARHQVILSNGAWTESFQPGDYSLRGVDDAQRQEIMELFPELAEAAGLTAYAAARKTLKRHEAIILSS